MLEDKYCPLLFSCTGAAWKRPHEREWTDIEWATGAQYEAFPVNRYSNLGDVCGMALVTASKTDFATIEALTGMTLRTLGKDAMLSLEKPMNTPVVSLRFEARAIDANDNQGRATLYLYRAKCVTPFRMLQLDIGRLAEMHLFFQVLWGASDENKRTTERPTAGRIEFPELQPKVPVEFPPIAVEGEYLEYDEEPIVIEIERPKTLSVSALYQHGISIEEI